MRRHRRYEVDGRLKLKAGDKVKITALGRRMILKDSGTNIEPWELGIVEKIQYDLSEGRFFAVVRIAGTSFWMPLSGLIYYSD